MSLVKRKRKDFVKHEPFGSNKEVGRRVAIEHKAAEGWKQPQTIEEPLKSGKVPLGKEKGYQKGKDTERKEV